MSDRRDVLEVLKTELAFLKLGGYSLRTSLAPELVFEDSPTCINCGCENHIPCSECALIQFVPPERRNETIACRQIPLNAAGETLESLYREGNAKAVEQAVGKWLRRTIDCLEKERGISSSPERDKGNEAWQALLKLFLRE